MAGILLFLFVVFIVVPIVELVLLMLFHDMTGSILWPLLLVIGTGVFGAALSRWQGAGVYWRIQNELRAGKLPTASLLDGFLILIAGLLLITPGILSDCIGITLLIPPIRLLYRTALIAWIKRYFKLSAFPMNGFQAGETREFYRSEVIDSYVVEKTETPH